MGEQLFLYGMNAEGPVLVVSMGRVTLVCEAC